MSRNTLIRRTPRRSVTACGALIVVDVGHRRSFAGAGVSLLSMTVGITTAVRRVGDPSIHASIIAALEFAIRAVDVAMMIVFVDDCHVSGV